MLWPLSVVLVANTNGRLAIPALARLLVSLYGSPIILVLSASNIFTKFRRGHPQRGR